MNETLQDRNKKLVQRFFHDLVNDRDYSVIPAIFSPDVEIMTGLRGVEGVGLRGIGGVNTWIRQFHDAFSDCRDEVLGQWAEGDVVITHILYRGTNDGVWLGKPPTGEEIAWTAVAIHTIRDGLIVRKTGAIDQTDAFRHLGWLDA